MAKMTYKQFREIVASIPDCKDFESFLFERGWQEWMDSYVEIGGSNAEIVRVLKLIWTLRENPIIAIENAAKIGHKELGCEYSIPERTIQNWANGVNDCPKYTWTMLAYCVFVDRGLI